MAIGTITLAASGGGQPGSAFFFDRITFAGDASYPTNGMALEALLETKLGKSITVLGVWQADKCGGYLPIYDHAASKVLVYQYPTSIGPATEVPNTTNLSGVTFTLLVCYQ